jgi:hypothetical protein
MPVKNVSRHQQSTGEETIDLHHFNSLYLPLSFHFSFLSLCAYLLKKKAMISSQNSSNHNVTSTIYLLNLLLPISSEQQHSMLAYGKNM